jgi:8-oxo-dGTP pyrophosphatase MutT (NUDIX family)
VTQIYRSKPENFLALVEVSAIYVFIGGKILFLQRALGQSEEGKWGVPAGKLEIAETAIAAARRELFEETGIIIKSEGELLFLDELYIRKPNIDYVYYSFELKCCEVPHVFLSREHSDYK